MKKKIWLGVLIVLILAVAAAWYLISPAFTVLEGSEESPIGGMIRLSGDFQESAHEVAGRALVVESDGQRVLRFEDFDTINGPNLHIYLSKDLEAEEFIDLGRIKATKGESNYQIDENVNLEEYDKVLVWCVPFKVLFSYAELN